MTTQFNAGPALDASAQMAAKLAPGAAGCHGRRELLEASLTGWILKGSWTIRQPIRQPTGKSDGRITWEKAEEEDVERGDKGSWIVECETSKNRNWTSCHKILFTKESIKIKPPIQNPFFRHFGGKLLWVFAGISELLHLLVVGFLWRLQLLQGFGLQPIERSFVIFDTLVTSEGFKLIGVVVNGCKWQHSEVGC